MVENLFFQMKYSIIYQDSVGLSNGEQCKRLWSYLRQFSSMTREMTASHRQDVLTDALLYYSRKVSMKTGLMWQFFLVSSQCNFLNRC